MKICYDCGEAKEYSEYCKNNAKSDGLNHICKRCAGVRGQVYFRTEKGLIKRIFHNQKRRSKDDNSKKVKYTFDEFYKWCCGQGEFYRLHKNWVESGYDKHKTPSVDRIDDYGCYEFKNIQLMTWGCNMSKGFKGIVDRVNTKRSQTIMSCNIKSGKVNIYETIIDAKNDLGISSASDIVSCIKGSISHISGHYFCYALISRSKIKSFVK